MTLIEALLDHTPSHMRRGFAVAFDELMSDMAEGHVVLSGRFGSVSAPVSELPAWWGWHLQPGDDPLFMTMQTPEGERIYDVAVRFDRAAADSFSEPAPPDSFETFCAPVAIPSIPTAGAPLAAARWIAGEDRIFSADDYRDALSAFGLQLSADGQCVDRVVLGSRGRKPSLALLLVEAWLPDRLPKRRQSAADLAVGALRWLKEKHPTLTPPPAESVERTIYRGAAKQTKAPARIRKGEDSCG